MGALKRSLSVLIFCATKKGCEAACDTVSHVFTQTKFNTLYVIVLDYIQPHRTYNPDQEVSKRREALVAKLKCTSVGLDPILESSIPQGVAFHHAGLTIEEREVCGSAVL